MSYMANKRIGKAVVRESSFKGKLKSQIFGEPQLFTGYRALAYTDV